MLYQEVLNSGEPDAVYEFFWYNFKASVLNFPAANKEQVPIVSERLNLLKSAKRYDDIIKEINGFLTDFLWRSVALQDNMYHLEIASTNVKRWLNLPKIKDDNLVALKVIYGISLKHKDPIVQQMMMNLHGTEEFDREHVIASMTRFCYRRANEGTWPLAILTRLTQEPVTQEIVVKTLRSLGLTVPDSIRNCAKIIKQHSN